MISVTFKVVICHEDQLCATGVYKGLCVCVFSEAVLGISDDVVGVQAYPVTVDLEL